MVGWEYWVLLLSSQLIEWWFHAGKGKPRRQEATAPFHHASHNTGMSLGDKQPIVPYYRSRAVAQELCPGREAAVKTQVSLWDFPGGSDGKASAYHVGDPCSIPGSGRSPGEGNENPLQYSCLENPTDGGAWQATVHGIAKSDTTERLQFQFPFEKTLIETIIGKPKFKGCWKQQRFLW